MKQKYMHCNKCEDFQEHDLIGKQKIEGITEYEGSMFYYYNCSKCNNTKVQVVKPSKLDYKLKRIGWK